jgi:formiminotetrahydrofolate cyclodeaminase
VPAELPPQDEPEVDAQPDTGPPDTDDEGQLPGRTSAVASYLDALGAATPAPAGGSAAGLVGAIAAALVELAAGVSGEETTVAEARALRARLAALADEDSQAYAAFLRTGSDADRDRTIDVPLEIAETAEAVAALATGLAGRAKPAVRGDAEAAGELAAAAARVAARLVELNRTAAA